MRLINLQKTWINRRLSQWVVTQGQDAVTLKYITRSVDLRPRRFLWKTQQTPLHGARCLSLLIAMDKEQPDGKVCRVTQSQYLRPAMIGQGRLVSANHWGVSLLAEGCDIYGLQVNWSQKNGWVSDGALGDQLGPTSSVDNDSLNPSLWMIKGGAIYFHTFADSCLLLSCSVVQTMGDHVINRSETRFLRCIC